MTAAAKLLVVAAALAAVAGCEPPGQVSRMMPPPVADIDQLDLHLLSVSAVNWDDQPGPDGVRLRLFCWEYHQSLPVMVKGTMEVMVFEGRLSPATVDKAKPFHVWKLTTEDLSTFAGRSTVGWCYVMQLAWDKNVPKTRKITLLARYISATGVQTFSAPVSIPMAG